MADTIIDGEARSLTVPEIGLGNALANGRVDALGRLEIALERQIALREFADRALVRAREQHEDAFEQLLVRCRTLEDEKAGWVESEAASLERVTNLERHLAHFEREAAHASELLITERDQLATEREAVLTRNLVEAEERFRVDAFRLTAIVALRTKELEAALAQAAEERAGRESAERRLAAVLTSSSWKLGRPLRVLKRALRRRS